MNRISLPFTVLLIFCLHACVLGRQAVDEPDVTDQQTFVHYRNLLPNEEMESDEDLNNIPDGWFLYSWIPEHDGFLKEAVMRYLDLQIPEIGVSMEGRRAFLGERSVRFFTPTGKIGPGIWTTLSLSPGIYTLSLVARSAVASDRVVATFLAQGGKLTQVDRKWRWIHQSEVLPYATPEAVISLNDWTFREGGVYVDHVSLIKLPFEILYEREVALLQGMNTYTVKLRQLPDAILPIGVNLEVQQPSGKLVRKNMELEITRDNSSFTFTLLAEEAGTYSITLELYNPRSTSILYIDEKIRGTLAPDSVRREIPPHLEESDTEFFPVGISVRGYEIEALEGKGMNAILLKDPIPASLGEVISKAARIGLEAIIGVEPVDSSSLRERERDIVSESRGASSVIGYSLLSGWGKSKERAQALRAGALEIKALNPDCMVFLRNYLPASLDGELLSAIDAVFIDPFPVTIPSKPLYTISQWFEGARRAGGREKKLVAMIQSFGGWPQAKREPTVQEVRALTRLALNQGTDGMIFHTFSGDYPYFDDPSSSNWDIRRSPLLWEGVGVLVREVRAFHRRFGKPRQLDPPIRLLPEGVFDRAYFTVGDSLFMQVVNVMPRSAGLCCLSPECHEGEVVEELIEQRHITCGEGFFEDRYAPYGVKIYAVPPAWTYLSAGSRALSPRFP